MFATLLTAAAVFTAAPAVEAQSTDWLTCAYQKPGTEQVIKECRLITLTENVHRVEWSDGLSDVFYYTGNDRYVDTLGGVWYSSTEVHRGYNFLHLKSASSGMLITVLAA